ncbi:MAG: translation elongation factor Ts [Deltaproteobacteria bacterium]|nr:translation elongation factor Ts [Deltaproteobacteria bacterium]
MTNISAGMVKDLRSKTGSGMMDCKKALVESDGDFAKAVDFLRKKGLATASKRADRQASQGTIQSYVHLGGKIGSLAEVNCETDFVAKNEDFIAFAKDIAMQVAASAPISVKKEDVSQDVIDRELSVYKGQAKEMGKPENIAEKIAEGKLRKFFEDNCLMNQVFIKDTSKTVEDLLNELIAKTGEKIEIKRFARFEIKG